MIPEQMNAVAIARFGGPEVLSIRSSPVPTIDDDQVLVRVAYAGVGSWDPFEREGGFAAYSEERPRFPLTLGSDGSGTVAAVGSNVDRFRVGDDVVALGGGFYAEYVAVDADRVAPRPIGMAEDEAGAFPISALTAMRGIGDVLGVTPGQSLMITGASGDVGHVAVQVGKALGARVLAIASGDDGVRLARAHGADDAVDGRTQDVAAAARRLAADGADAVLLLSGGEVADAAISVLRTGGLVAYPLGVQPEPAPRAGAEILAFDLTADRPDATRRGFDRLAELHAARPFRIALAETLPLAEAKRAHRSLSAHRLGKIVLEVRSRTRGG